MKRIISVIISALLIISSVLFVSAADSVSFTVGSVEAECGRITLVDVFADCDTCFASAIFDFNYDKTLLEFRGCDTDENTAIKYNPTQSGVRVVYLCMKNSSLSNKSIFKLKFKTLNEGRADISFFVSDCVNNNAEDLSVGKCTGGNIEINGFADSNSNAAAKSGSSSKASSKANSAVSQSSKAQKAQSSKAISDDEQDEDIENLGTINDVVEKPIDLQWVLYALIGVGIIIILLTGVLIGRKVSLKNENKTNKN